MWLLGQAAPAEPSLNYLLQFGVVGLGLVALIMGWIVPRYVLHRQREDFADTLTRVLADKDAQLTRAWAAQERAEAQRDDLIAAYEQRVLPVMTEFAATSDHLDATMREVVALLQQPGPDNPWSRRHGT